MLTEDRASVSHRAFGWVGRSDKDGVQWLPWLGPYTRVIGQHAVIVISETRDDPDWYSQALKQFRLSSLIRNRASPTVR